MTLNQSYKFFHKVCSSWRTALRFPQQIRVRRMCSSTTDVLLEDIADKGLVTLNRPKALNALNLNMIRLIHPKLKEWEGKKSLVIIKGAGDKAFCAGGDVLSVTEAGKTGKPLTKEFFKEEYILNCLIGTYHVPFIALIDGITMGGGVGLSVHGHYRVATERTLFAMPETSIGLFPDVGGSHFLIRLGGKLGIFLALTGHRLKGRDTVKAGIATHFCDSDKIESLEKTLLGLKSPYPEEVAKVLDDFSTASTIDREKEFSLKPFLPQIQKLFQGDSIEEIMRNFEKDGSEFALKYLDLFRKMSPTSMKISFEALKQGEHKTLQDCLIMEYRLSQRCCEGHDFYEGVRAVLVDRDNNPKWNPGTLEEVTQDTVRKYFSPLPDNNDLVF